MRPEMQSIVISPLSMRMVCRAQTSIVPSSHTSIASSSRTALLCLCHNAHCLGLAVKPWSYLCHQAPGEATQSYVCPQAIRSYLCHQAGMTAWCYLCHQAATCAIKELSSRTVFWPPPRTRWPKACLSPPLHSTLARFDPASQSTPPPQGVPLNTLSRTSVAAFVSHRLRFPPASPVTCSHLRLLSSPVNCSVSSSDTRLLSFLHIASPVIASPVKAFLPLLFNFTPRVWQVERAPDIHCFTMPRVDRSQLALPF